MMFSQNNNPPLSFVMPVHAESFHESADGSLRTLNEEDSVQIEA